MKKEKRILSTLMALVLCLSMMPAMAEAPATQASLSDLFGDNGTRQFNVQLNINPQAAALMQTLTGEMPDEQSGSIISTIISAVNKLSFSALVSKDAVSAVIGSPVAPVMEFQAGMNQETFENTITGSMLPGVALSIDPEMIRQFMDQASGIQVDPEEVMELVQLHLQRIGGVLNETAAAFTSEEGNFAVEGFGTFTKRTSVNLTTHLLAGVMQKLADIYNNAPEHREFMQKFLSQSNAFAGDMPATGATPDFGMMLDDAAKQGMAEPDTAIMAGWLYEGDESIYFDAATAEGSQMPTKLDILIGTDEIEVRIIGQGSSFSAESPEPASTVTDWVQIEQDILAGNNYFDRLITLNVHKKNELPQMNSEAVLSIIAGGMNFGVTIKSESNLDTMEGSTSFALSMMQPEPLLTLTVSVKPTDEQPAPPALEGAEVIVVKESGMTDEDNELLETSLTQALFELFTRVGAALPEEGPILMSLLGDMMAVSEETPPVEDLQPEGTETPLPESSEEPATVNP